MVENDRFVSFPFMRVFGYPEIKEFIYWSVCRTKEECMVCYQEKGDIDNVRLVSGVHQIQLRVGMEGGNSPLGSEDPEPKSKHPRLEKIVEGAETEIKTSQLEMAGSSESDLYNSCSVFHS